MLLSLSIFNLFVEGYDEVSNMASQNLDNYPVLSRGIIIFVFAFSVWRLLRFTVLPTFAPDNEPHELPYMIPGKHRTAMVGTERRY